MLWSDDELKEHGERFQTDLPGYVMPVGEREHRARFAELYRLARLGLAAEQVGREAIEAVAFDNEGYTADDFAALQAFLNHEAWKK